MSFVGFPSATNTILPTVIAAVGGCIALLLLWRRVEPRWVALLFGLSSALSYIAFVHGAGLPFYGLQGDETFVMAFLEHVATGHFFSDFSYAALPPFYPPLYFWVVGGISWFLHWNGVQAGKLGAALVFGFLPFLSVVLQEHLWQKRPEAERPAVWGMVFAAIAYLPLVGWENALLKPYEVFTGLLAVQLAAFFFVRAGEKWSWRDGIFYSITFFLLLLTYYFWGIQIAIAGLLSLALSRTVFFRRLRAYALVGSLALVGSAIFWLPYLISLTQGFSSAQGTFLLPNDFALFFPFLPWQMSGLVFLAGLVAFVRSYRAPVMQSLALLAVTPYLWQLCGAVLFLAGKQPFLPSKPFLFFGGAAFVTAAGWGIGWWGKKMQRSWHISLVTVCVVVLTSFGGVFALRPETQAALSRMRAPSDEVQQLDAFFKTHADVLQHTYLSSGIGQLSAFVPLDTFIEPTVHFSHPAARWPERFAFLEELAASSDAATFAKRLRETPWGSVDGLLLYRAADAYLLYFQEDAWPSGTRERVISLPAVLVSSTFWQAQAHIGDFFVFTRRVP
jgi:hypothetical protein